ncbi:MAG: TylF/MycF/NovP-related O-methyltransferase [Candidatus Eremiobacterota bacterium]
MSESPLTGQPGQLQNTQEKSAANLYEQCFDTCPDPLSVKLDNFPKYCRLQALTRFMVRHELFRRVVGVKGSIVECGVFRGGGLMAWANLSAILEPANFMRRIYGFDTFEGFPSTSEADRSKHNRIATGQLASSSHEELKTLIQAFDQNRYLGHMPKVELIKGDAGETIPRFVQEHPHLAVALLYMDFDLYEPTLVALEHFLPRMPRGAILAFDELDHPAWPGETLAALHKVGLRNLRLRRFNYDPYVAYARLE